MINHKNKKFHFFEVAELSGTLSEKDPRETLI
jgi:hypothetical protein